MNIPNVPTDNLYKFIALTGVILLLLSLFYPEIKRQELLDEITTINGQIKKLDYELLPLEEQTKDIKRKIDKLDKICNCGFKSVVTDSMIIKPLVTDGPKEIMELSQQIDKLIVQRGDLIRETSFKAIEINTKQELINNKKENLDDINDAANFFGPLSLLLSTLGFILWFTQTQRFQDSLLKGQYVQYKKFDTCQSSGLKLSADTYYQNLNKDDQQKVKFCSNCYSDNKFTEPDLSLVDMKLKVKERCKELGFGKVMTFVYLSRLDELERWQKQFKWK